jgi:hypothetical protein
VEVTQNLIVGSEESGGTPLEAVSRLEVILVEKIAELREKERILRGLEGIRGFRAKNRSVWERL